MVRSVLSVVVMGGLAVGGGACVGMGTYDVKVRELNESVRKEKAQAAEIDRLKAELAEATHGLAILRRKFQELGQNVDHLSSERGRLAAGLQDAEKQLDEVRRQKAAAEARAATFRSLVDRLRSMIDAGQLRVTIRNGRMLIVLPNDVLFDSGRIDLKTAGKTTLTQVGQVLAGIGDRRFLVAGHTDNLPIKTAKFASNWELSTGRAVSVAKLLSAGGVKPELVGAAGYAEFAPIASNETPDGRRQNRRIEIILEPNLSDLPDLESLLSEVKH